MEPTDNDLRDLMAAWLGAPLTEERFAALEARLRSDGAFRELAAQEIVFSGQLRAVQTAEPRWLVLEQLLGADQFEASAFEMQTMERIGRYRFSFSRAWLLAAASVGILVGGALVWAWMGGDRLTTPVFAKVPEQVAREVAVVTYTRDLKGPHAGYCVQDRIRAGALKIEAGQLQVRFLSGATVTIEGPAELDLRSEKEAVVHRGMVLAEVPAVAEGFVLQTKQWQVVDRGTVFGVDARNAEKPEVHVLKGKVEMRRGQPQTEMVLTTGQGVRMGQNGAPLPIEAQPGEFPNPESIVAQASERSRLRYEGWLKASEQLARDESLLLYYDFERVERGRGVIVNRAPRAREGSEGILVGGEWTEGRWREKRGVRFVQVGDLIRSRTEEQLSTVSWFAWVRLDHADPALPVSLMLSPKVGPGQVYWLIWPRAFVSGGRGPAIHFVKTSSKGRDDHYREEATFSRPVTGRWMQLGVVHDAQAGRFQLYSDGKRVMDGVLKDTNPLRMEELVFGNWGYSKEPRNFVGEMDELAIFRRALSEEEVAVWYERGRPE